jgi:uncharacterized protein (TIGR01777 family)
MKILVTGSTGLIGSALIPSLLADGHSVVRLVRRVSATPANEILWDPRLGTLNAAMLEGYDAMVHLAGESIAGARWTPENKRRILDSRVQGTRLLVEALLSLSKPPGVLISASAIGFYGNRGAEILREESPPGKGFLPDLCRQWEEAAQPASKRGIRVVTPRIGLVLSGRGGALARMLLPFKLGVGGKIGPGNQYMSWIALDDLVGSIRHMIQDQDLSGPVNAVSPQPVTNLEFTRVLGRTLSRPTLFPLPAFAARIVLGEMADELLLASARVEPARLLAAGCQFRFPELQGALRHVLNA